MGRRTFAIVLVVASSLVHQATATEPNETFSERTVLTSGTLTVSDELTVGGGSEPDTFLGIRNQFDEFYDSNDNDSPVGNGFASGAVAATNSGSINFSVTGYPDEFFEGGHGEEGDYEVFVEVYDFFEELVDSFSEVRTLTPGAVHDFDYSDFNWLNGFYYVYIDNTVGSIGDVDFFTFTGLTAGASFTAETFDPTLSGVDTVLGWFDSTGTFLAEDDDSGEDVLSKLEGVVPNDGMLTFAVTGFGDLDDAGDHSESGSYELRLTFDAGLPGDFNNDSQVDADDLAVWRQNFGAANNAADADGDGDSDGRDLIAWQRSLGAGVPASGAIQAAPEPNALILLAMAAAGLTRVRVRRSS